MAGRRGGLWPGRGRLGRIPGGLAIAGRGREARCGIGRGRLRIGVLGIGLRRRCVGLRRGRVSLRRWCVSLRRWRVALRRIGRRGLAVARVGMGRLGIGLRLLRIGRPRIGRGRGGLRVSRRIGVAGHRRGLIQAGGGRFRHRPRRGGIDRLRRTDRRRFLWHHGPGGAFHGSARQGDGLGRRGGGRADGIVAEAAILEPRRLERRSHPGDVGVLRHPKKSPLRFHHAARRAGTEQAFIHSPANPRRISRSGGGFRAGDAAMHHLTPRRVKSPAAQAAQA